MRREATTEPAGVPLRDRQVIQMRRKRRTQREVLLAVLRGGARRARWVSLAELAEKTKFPPASISAQLRHLRKAKYGGWTVARRRREWVKEEMVWEYRLGAGGEGS